MHRDNAQPLLDRIAVIRPACDLWSGRLPSFCGHIESPQFELELEGRDPALLT